MFWGPTAKENSNEIPYAPYSKAEKLCKVADWTSLNESRRGSEAQFSTFSVPQDSFSLIDRQNSALKKNAIRSVRPILKKNLGSGDNQQQLRTNKYSEMKPQKPRESSIKVNSSWKIIQELDFGRMKDLYFMPGEVQDLDIRGKLKYFDNSLNKVAIKSDVRLKQASWNIPNQATSTDPVLMDFKSEKNTIICTDVVLAALMCSARSVYSWDMVITKEKNRLILDKREGGPLDFETVNENAAEPPVEVEKDKDTNINSRETLGFEATMLNKAWQEHAVTEQQLEFKNSLPIDSNISRVHRYRKFELDNTDLFIRTSVHCAINGNTGTVGNLGIVNCDFPLEQTGLANTFALNEFDYRSQGSGGAFDWRKKLETQKGGVLATEFKNNACKLSRWAMQSMLSGVDFMKIAFISRNTPRDRKRHQILSTSTYEPFDFAERIGFDVGNAWGVVKAISDLLFEAEDGTFILVRDPIRTALIIYKVL